MEVDTLRFGPIRAKADDVLCFPAGLLGLEDCRHWIMLADPARSFAWLQSVIRPEIAVAVVSPRRFVPDYQLRVARQELAPLALRSLGAAAALAIVGKTDQAVTLNLRAPLIINIPRRVGRQVVANGNMPVRYELENTRPAIRKIA